MVSETVSSEALDAFEERFRIRRHPSAEALSELAEFLWHVRHMADRAAQGLARLHVPGQERHELAAAIRLMKEVRVLSLRADDALRGEGVYMYTVEEILGMAALAEPEPEPAPARRPSPCGQCERHWHVDTMSRCVCTVCGAEL